MEHPNSGRVISVKVAGTILNFDSEMVLVEQDLGFAGDPNGFGWDPSGNTTSTNRRDYSHPRNANAQTANVFRVATVDDPASIDTKTRDHMITYMRLTFPVIRPQPLELSLLQINLTITRRSLP